MPNPPEELQVTWLRILEKVQESLSKSACEKWLAPVRPLRLDGGELELAAPNDFTKDWILNRYVPILEDAVSDVLGEDAPEAERAVSRKVQKAERAAKGSRRSTAGVSADAVHEDAPVQTTLLDGDDEEAASVLPAPSSGQGKGTRGKGAADLPSPIAPGDASTLNPRGYNPLFLYGGVGLGKTHLMHAIGHRILGTHPEMRVLYVSSEKFTNELINSIRDGHPERFRDKYRTIDVLMVDDIQFISGKTSTQEEFFHTFNALHDAGKQIILSSDRPPKEVEKLEERLRSRFEWGLITDIQAPDLETRIAILRKKAMVDQIDVPNDVMFSIANRIDTNIRELEGALTRVVAYASLTKQPVTTELVAEALKDLFPAGGEREVTLEIIQEIVASYFQIPVDDLHSKKRSRSIAFPRQIAMYLCRELTESSLPSIGQFFGGRDHTTVLHAYDKIKTEKETDDKLAKILTELVARIQKM